jgi:hypothetical protein
MAVAAFGVELWALIDATVRPGPAYRAASRATKPAWVALTAVAAAIGLSSLPPLGRMGGLGGLAQIAAIVVAILYLWDVRPAVRGSGGGRRRPPSSRPGGW